MTEEASKTPKAPPPGYAPGIIARAAAMLGIDHAGYASLVEELRAIDGFRLRPWEAAVRAHRDAARQAREAARERERDPDWTSSLLRDRFGNVKPALSNVVAMLTHDPRWAGRPGDEGHVLRFNEFSGSIETSRRPPWSGPEADTSTAGEWSEQDDDRLVMDCERVLGILPSPGLARRAVEHVARRLAYHPIRAYLETCERLWDGTTRLDGWLSTYLGASKQEPAYLAGIGRRFMISAVARVFRPGCQVDHVLVLEGPQGARKTSAIRELAGAYYKSLGHQAWSGDKDSYLLLRDTWIGEFEELDGLSRAEASRSKRFVSCPTDAYRPPYAHAAIKVPRQCVFFGSVNPDANGYLRDATGGRRWWPCTIGRIDLEAVRRDRDLLWGEAVARFKSGEQWWPAEEDEPELREEQEDRYSPDPWEPMISDFVRGRSDVRMADILRGLLMIDPKDQNRGHETRVGEVMSRLGWRRVRPRTGSGSRERVYLAPQGDDAQEAAPPPESATLGDPDDV